MSRKKFNKANRYLTRGIQANLSNELQIILWDMVDQRIKRHPKIDYLQIFKFKVRKHKLLIEHSQEQPPIKQTHKIALKNNHKTLCNQRVYIIDDETHSTMLLASEY